MKLGKKCASSGIRDVGNSGKLYKLVLLFQVQKIKNKKKIKKIKEKKKIKNKK